MNQEEFINACYKIGMQNPWCSGRADFEDGNFLSEEDRLNRNSFTVFTDAGKLKDAFKRGNRCLGEAFVYRDLCFMNQVNGGDEWLTMKGFGDDVLVFESISWIPIIDDGEFDDLLKRLERATKKQCQELEY